MASNPALKIETLVRDVSDTARLIAYYRAVETERPDALFRDPIARRLAGERGEAIARALPGGMGAGWALVARTCVFDEIILQAVIREGVDTIVNLAAGLDTRPYRLPLPKALRWIEVDLPDLIQFKEEALRGETASCRLERVALDLVDGEMRRAFFAKLGKESKKALVVTEGLVMYLTPEAVGALAADVAAVPSLRFWLLDVFSPDMVRWSNRRWGKIFGTGARLHFGTDDLTAYFASLRWRARSLRHSLDEARRLRREMPGAPWLKLLAAFVSKERRDRWRRYFVFALLEQTR